MSSYFQSFFQLNQIPEQEEVGNLLTWIRKVAVLFDKILAKLVKGPLVNIVILDAGSRDSVTDFQISNARGCLSSG